MRNKNITEARTTSPISLDRFKIEIKRLYRPIPNIKAEFLRSRVHSLGCTGEENVYAIGLADNLVTIHSQQARAICLARLLTEEVHHELRNNICIIGGGVAGLTFSLELIKNGWTDITILERLPDLLGIQNGCDTRWVHPHIINWPSKGSIEKRSSLGTLDWEASTASNVTYEIEKQWMREVDEKISTKKKGGRPERLLSVHVGVTYVHAKPGRAGIEIEWIRDSTVRPLGFGGSKISNSEINEYSYVVFATGYGIEQGSKHSYWRNENYGQIQIDGVQKGYVISGLGDGAISDLLRITTKHFRPDRAIEEIIQLEQLKDELLTIKNKSKKNGSSLIKSFLLSSNKKGVSGELWRQLFKHFEKNKREDSKVILHHNSSNGFAAAFDNSPASFLSKLFLFILYRNGAFQYVDLSTCQNENSAAEKHNIHSGNIIRRHGVDRIKVIENIFNSAWHELLAKEQPYEECLTYLNKDKTSCLDYHNLTLSFEEKFSLPQTKWGSGVQMKINQNYKNFHYV